MDRAGAIGVVLLTTAAGACAGFGVAGFLIQWLQIPNREGASGYFAVYVTGFGLIGGFLVGLVTALVSHSGFLRSEGYALAAVAVLAVAGAVLPIVLDDEGPTLNGEKLVAEVEVKCPPGWAPDNKAKFESGGFCWLQFRAEDGTLQENPIVSGDFVLTNAAGQWLVRCGIDLNKTTRNRYLRVFVGNKTDLTIPLPFPRHPRLTDKQWTPWSTSGFLPQKDKPVQPGYAFRCRVQTDGDYKREHPDPDVAFQEARKKAIAGMPADAPISAWLPFFENRDGRTVPRNEGVFPELEAVKARPTELAPLLRSSDGTVVRQAVFAAAALEQTPASLVEPLTTAGRHVIELLRIARAGALPDDPDLTADRSAYQFFFYWNDAMEHAGTAGAGAWRAMLEQIEPEVRGSRQYSDQRLIEDRIHKDLQTLGAPAH